VLLAMQGLGKPGRNQLKFIEWQAYDLHEQTRSPAAR
jgi:trimethylamine-N-oxide reductase (cytochrome c)